MVRPIARRKVRNPHRKTTRRNANKTRTKRYKGHPLLREHWDDSLTVTENYRNLGLVSRLNGVSGGVVKNVIPAHQPKPDDEDGEADGEGAVVQRTDGMTEEELRRTIPQGYGIIERDEAGNVVKIIMAEDGGDPLDSDYDAGTTKAKKEGARILEKYASEYTERQKSWLSEGERQKLQSFVDKHGSDYNAMFWDGKLNTQQLTRRQLQKKIESFLAEKDKALGPAPPSHA
ncbi:Nucleolar protein 16 [Coemansia sp. RSA 552]|nr:Nucleolar protein 16 [Coemansia sp. RSA 552]